MEQLVPWLTLKRVPGIGNHLFHRLVSHFGSPDHVLNASGIMLGQVPGMTSRLVSAIQRNRTSDWVLGELERCNSMGYSLITLNDTDYPALLLNLPDPPPVLYCNGSLERDLCHIAVVGSRRATAYGKAVTHRLCRDLSTSGVSIVSGMALGIDTAAHLGALNAGGSTVAVLGSGLNRIYPPENRSLFARIAQNGAVLSEFSLDAAPEPHHFPQRNRIISGMALGTVVVEAARRSGSLITARLAAEQGREVYAVPGSIHAPTTRGTHELIRQGAKLIETAQDVIEEILPQVAVQTGSNGDAPRSGTQANIALELDEDLPGCIDRHWPWRPGAHR
jgi:DNA processing protein